MKPLLCSCLLCCCLMASKIHYIFNFHWWLAPHTPHFLHSPPPPPPPFPLGTFLNKSLTALAAWDITALAAWDITALAGLGLYCPRWLGTLLPSLAWDITTLAGLAHYCPRWLGTLLPSLDLGYYYPELLELFRVFL